MRRQRPDDLPGLLWLLARTRLRRPGLVLAALLLLVVAAVVYALLSGPPDVRVGTFNIQDYPDSPGQAAGAIQYIDDLDVDAVAIQEITDPEIFDDNVEAYLGDDWEVAHVDQDDAYHLVAAVWNDTALKLLDTETHRETVVEEDARATLEVRFKTRSGDEPRRLRMFVVHLAAHPEGTQQRREQLEALRPIVDEATDSSDEIVVLGDFNTTGIADRYEVDRFAADTGLHWSTEHLRCTVYWDRDDVCMPTPLDHVLATTEAESIRAAGACETVGCEPTDRCPRYVDLVSDHCPVVGRF